MKQQLKYGDWRLRTSSKKKPGDWVYVMRDGEYIAVQIGFVVSKVINIKTKAAR